MSFSDVKSFYGSYCQETDDNWHDCMANNAVSYTRFSAFKLCYVIALRTRYRTIVTTACGEAHRINHFSSPDVDYLGFLPTGSATEDNARTIEDNMVSMPNDTNSLGPRVMSDE